MYQRREQARQKITPIYLHDVKANLSFRYAFGNTKSVDGSTIKPLGAADLISEDIFVGCRQCSCTKVIKYSA
jgi:hypothetical protein